ncbi:MAG TPA: hypothetical protein VMJ30_10200, partial [Gemmatimonadales bacterium]|nr:hypothetical protein [Gemmatimonadales bacterium]
FRHGITMESSIAPSAGDWFWASEELMTRPGGPERLTMDAPAARLRLLGECARYLFEVKDSRQARALTEVPPRLNFAS